MDTNSELLLSPDADVEEVPCFQCDMSPPTLIEHVKELGHRIVWDGSYWGEKNVLQKIFYILLLPTVVLRNLTIPTGNYPHNRSSLS